MLKRLTSLLLSILFCVMTALPVMAETSPVSTYSNSYLVADAYTGDVLFSKSADTKFEPASCTKILTALVVLEKCAAPGSGLTLDSQTTVSHNAVWSIDRGSSHIALQEGEVVTIRELLYGLLVASANDCAVALAEAVSGSVENFCTLMNSRAKELGALNTNFVNPHGLHAENHMTTAADLAKIMQACLQNEDFVTIQSSNYYAVGPTNKSSKAHTFSSVYRMIKGGKYYDSRVVCGKSGYTTEAGNSLVTYGVSGDMGVIVVTMNSASEKNAYADTEKLMDYAFDNYHLQKLNIPEVVNMDTAMGKFTAAVVQKPFVKYTGSNGSITSQNGVNTYALLPAGISADSLRYEAVMDTAFVEIKTGDIIGALCFYSDDVLVAHKLLMATSDPVLPEEQAPQKKGLWAAIGAFLWAAVKVFFIVLFILVVLVLCIRTYNIQKRKKRRKVRLEQMRRQRRD